MQKIHKYTEQIDMAKLSLILDNIEQFKDKIGLAFNPRTNERLDWTATISKLREYKASKNAEGVSHILYSPSRNSPKGRLFSKTPSLQGMPRPLRHTIAKDIMYDIDLKNCHPEILKWYCRNEGIKLEYVAHYTENREKCLHELQTIFSVTKDEAKRHVLSLINGGTVKVDWDMAPDWFYNMYIEIGNVHEIIKEKNPVLLAEAINAKGDDYYNLNGSVCNKLFCMYENIILNHMIDFCETHSVQISALCFDGLMLYKSSFKDENALTTFLNNIENYVEQQMDNSFRIVVKEMDEGLDEISFEGFPPKSDDVLTSPVADDNYFLCHFLEESRHCFSSEDDLIEFFSTNFPRVMAKIAHAKPYYIEKRQDGFFLTYCREPDSHWTFSFMASTVKKDGVLMKPETITLGKLFTKAMSANKIKIFADVVFNPIETRREYFNTWTPMVADVVREPNMERLNPLLEFLETVICNGDERLYRYLISWVRHICLFPHIRTETCLVFSSKQGTGKGSFVDFLSKYVFGYKIARDVKFKELTGKFNEAVKNKVFISVDEIASTTEEFYSNFDNMKHLITAPKISIEPKGLASYMIDNLANYAFMTNHYIRLENGDRRYVVFPVNESRIGDFQYWDTMYKTVFKCADTGIDFFNFLRAFPADKTVNLRDIPMTDLKRSMIENSMNSVEMFLKEVKDRSLPAKLCLFDGSEMPITDIPAVPTAVRKNDLYVVYTNWCAEVGENPPKKQKMFNNYLEEKRTAKVRYWEV